MSIEQAAGLPSSAVAGYSLVHHLGITSNDALLIHGAAGAVGSAAAQIALHYGATVIGTASERNHDYLRSVGVIPVNYEDNLVEAVRRISPITASADAVGGATSVAATQALLPPTGRAVTAWGDAHSEAAGIPWVEHPEDELEQVVRLASEDALTVRIAQQYLLAHAPMALRHSRTLHATGKILLQP